MVGWMIKTTTCIHLLSFNDTRYEKQSSSQLFGFRQTVYYGSYCELQTNATYADSFFAVNVNNSVIVDTEEVIESRSKAKPSPTFETSLEVAVESR